ncbi:MAG: hypothetical protein M0R77_10840 [Gammaproteobacteria bacterium]|nr:hypothetical protein [Gammaproteobacteria bacterium]
MIATDRNEIRKAQVPHELFLFNLVFNHIFLFIVTISAPSLQFLVAIVPALSVLIVGYTLLATRRAAQAESPFVHSHWRMAKNGSLLLLGVWLFAALFIGAVLASAGGVPKPWHYAVGSVVFIPTMVFILVLILFGSEALQHARAGTLPSRARRRAPVNPGN